MSRLTSPDSPVLILLYMVYFNLQRREYMFLDFNVSSTYTILISMCGEYNCKKETLLLGMVALCTKN
jgi:hypothetical protein